jgi:HSP90 family molecular chaperone
LIEAYTKKGYEVLVMSEEIDEFVVAPSVRTRSFR